MDTRLRKPTTKIFKTLQGQDCTDPSKILQEGKHGPDRLLHKLSGILVETIMELDRNEQAEFHYQTKTPELYKWAAQAGSVFIEEQKVLVIR